MEFFDPPIWIRQTLQFWGVPLGLGVLFHIVSTFFQREIAYWSGARLFSYLTAPGVVIHELSHALLCIPFAHQIEEISLFHYDKDGTLGFVRHSYSAKNPWAVLGNAWIGTAPIWVGLSLLFLLLQQLYTPTGGVQFVFQDPLHWLWLYLLIAIGAHMRLSLADLKGSWFSLLLWTIIWIGVFYALNANSIMQNKIDIEYHQLVRQLVYPLFVLWSFFFGIATILRAIRMMRA